MATVSCDNKIRQAEQICLEQGVRLTPIRRRVLELICESQGGIKAYTLLEQLTKEKASARPPTVYRALDFLLEQGLIHKIESLNAFVSCSHPLQHDAYQLLICDGCGFVEELHCDDVTRLLHSQAERRGFQSYRQTIEVHGVCPDCQQ